jgi:glycosyltransferase involved in cell wall biosynthesis
MRIGIFVLMAGREAGGPETYEIELIRALARLDKNNEYVIYCTGPEAMRACQVKQDNFRMRVLGPNARAISVGVTLPLMLMRDGVDFCHATFTPPPFITRALAFTMHCVSSFVHPEFYKPVVAWRLNRLLKTGINTAQRILCVSRTTMLHLEEMFSVSPERMSVTYNGVGERFVPTPPEEARKIIARELGISDPFLLFVGKLQGQKNVERLVRAFHRFCQETRSQTKLVMVGRPAGNAVDVPALLSELNLQKDVVLAGYAPAGLLPQLYSASRAFVFPSVWEGFGIPVVEAMACGTPVITSTATCLPEIVGDAAITVDPTSVEAIAEAMARVDGSEEQRQRLIQAGLQRASLFTWDKCARATLEAYAQMARS